MSAPTREELLSAYLDEELSGEERAQVEAWLAESAEYRQLYDELRAVRNSVRALPRHKLSEDLGAAVLRRAERAVLSSVDQAEKVTVAPHETAVSTWLRGASKRMYLWPAVAVAAALLVAMFNTQREGEGEREVARREAPAGAAPTSSALRSERDLSAEPPVLRKDAGPQGPRSVDATASDSSEYSARQNYAQPPVGTQPKPSEMRGTAVNQPRAAQAPEAPNVESLAAQQAPQQQSLSLKLETSVSRALANSDQLNFIQCDVTPDFIHDNQMEKVLNSNTVPFKRLAAIEGQLEEKEAASRRANEPLPELRYALEATPAQVGRIVNELEQERGRKRVSNMLFGLQPMLAQDAPVDAAQQNKPAAGYYRVKGGQQPVTIYLRQMEQGPVPLPAAAAAPAAEPSPNDK